MSYYLTNEIAVDETRAIELLSNGQDGDQRVTLWTAPALIGAGGWLFYLGNGDPVLLTEQETTYTPSPNAWLETLGHHTSDVIEAIESSPADDDSKEWAVELLNGIDEEDDEDSDALERYETGDIRE